MIKVSRWTLAIAATSLLLLGAPGAWSGIHAPEVTGQAASAEHLIDVRVDRSSEGGLVVTLDADGEVPFESFVLDGPDRLVLDLPGVVNELGRYSFPVDRDGVVAVRAAQHEVDPHPVARVVFDLEHPLAYRIEPTSRGLIVRFGSEAASEGTAPTAVAAGPAPQGEPPLEEQPTLDETLARLLGGADEPGSPSPAAGAPVADEALGWGGRRPANDFEDTTEIAEVLAVEDDNFVVAVAAPEQTELAAAVANTETTERAVTQAEREAALPRSVGAEEIERLLNSPTYAAPVQDSQGSGRAGASSGAGFATRTIASGGSTYSGKRISLNLVDADIKQVFRLFHEISGLNFVLDPDVAGRVTIVLDQVPWDQALDLILKNNALDKVLEGNVLRIASTRKLAQEAAARKQLKEAEELEVEPVTVARTLSYAKAEEVQRVVREGGILSPRGKVIVDERTNTLIMTDIPKNVGPLDSLITSLDSETPQVMIEARIVETSRRYTRDLGVVWDVNAVANASRGTQTGVTFPNNAAVRYGLNLPGAGQASNLGFSLGNVVDSFTLDLELYTLESEGYGRILSSPKIATQNNERAEIEQGVRIPIVNTTATEINVEFVSASLKLSVTPQITAESTVILDVIVENNSPDFLNTSGGVPSIRTQRAQTKVLINDGGTTVIGGIFVVNEGVSETGVPWFRKIPIFGWLFKTQNITDENRELLIFITPKIIKLT